MLRRTNRSYRLELLTAEQFERVVLDILKDGFDLGWVRPELVVLALDTLSEVIAEEDGMEIAKRLAQKGANVYI